MKSFCTLRNMLRRNLEFNPEKAALIALPDEKWGEAVTAVVQLKTGVEVSEEELRKFCKVEIASYKVPRQVLFISEMPRSASGKILKYRLREQYKKAGSA